MTDRIEIRGLRAWGHHGVLDHEQRDGQVFVIDATLEVDVSAAAASDDLGDTIDYGALAAALSSVVADTRFDLIEALADRLAVRCLADPRVAAATVRVAKPHAPVTVDLDHVAVEVRRTR